MYCAIGTSQRLRPTESVTGRRARSRLRNLQCAQCAQCAQCHMLPRTHPIPRLFRSPHQTCRGAAPSCLERACDPIQQVRAAPARSRPEQSAAPVSATRTHALCCEVIFTCGAARVTSRAAAVGELGNAPGCGAASCRHAQDGEGRIRRCSSVQSGRALHIWARGGWCGTWAES